MAESPETPAAVTHPAWRGILPWCIAALALLAFGVALALGHFREQPAERPVVRFQIPAPEKSSFSSSDGSSTGPNLSPDGSRLTFVATDTLGRQMLWVRALDSLDLRELPGTEGAAFPFWSADNRSIGFSVNGKLKKIDASGGPPQTVCETGGTDSAVHGTARGLSSSVRPTPVCSRFRRRGELPLRSPRSIARMAKPPTCVPGSCPTADISCTLL